MTGLKTVVAGSGGLARTAAWKNIINRAYTMLLSALAIWGGEGNIRDRLYATAKKIGYRFPVIADRTAAIAGSAVIGEGTYIGKCAVVNADACVGKMCIINSCALVEHGSVVGDYSHIAVKAALCGNVHTGDHVFIGAGATVIQGTGIGAGSIVGAGSLVLGDIPGQQTVYGVYKNR